jgi:MYXO-CTERM domain-containing protein
MRRLFVLTLLLAAVVMTVSVAYGYVRGRTKGLKFTYWKSGCIFITPDSTGTPDLPATAVFNTVTKSIANWTNATAGCTYMKLMSQPPGVHEAHYDGINTIKFRSDRWCHPNDAQQNDVCYSSAAAGITTVFYVDHGAAEGTILDADIELNNLNFVFATIDPASPPGPTAPDGRSIADLENTLTHELGHVQGLDHTCADAATPPQEIDDTGNPPPACTAIPPNRRAAVTSATMYNFAEPDETSKRMPKADDVAGICGAYPTSADPHSCQPLNLADYNGSGCSVGGNGAGASGMLALLLLCGGALLRRRHQ